MKPGRELDALVAEKVIGWAQSQVEDAEYYIDEGGHTKCDLPSYQE